MTTSLIARLDAERRNAWELAKGILDAVDAEKRDMTGEEEQAWQRANADIDAKDARIAELLEVEKREAVAAERREAIERIAPKTPDAPKGDDERAKLVAFFRGQGGKSFEVRDLVKSTADTPKAGYTVPTSFRAQLMEHLIEVSSIRQAGAFVLSTASGEDLQIPKTTAHSSAVLVAEAAALTESDPTFGQVTLGAFKYGVLRQVSSELLTDTAVDLLGYMAREMGRAVGEASNTHFVTGDGSSKPNGVVTASTLGKTAAGAAAITANELIDLQHSVTSVYRNAPSAAWMMKDSTLAYVRKLRDDTGGSGLGNFLWVPGLTAGAPDTLLGKPVFTDPNMAAIATGNKTIIFGDISTYFIRDVNGVRFERSDDYAFNTDLVTFRCIFRTDGDLIDTTGAVKHLIQA